jgi:molybdopterin molybdotransferase
VCAILFMAPLIRALSGRQDVAWPISEAALGQDLPANDQREDYLRASLAWRPGGVPIATPVNHQDSSLLANLTRADALIIRPPHAPAALAGTPCRILQLPI